jgi:hypothetical protein
MEEAGTLPSVKALYCLGIRATLVYDADALQKPTARPVTTGLDTSVPPPARLFCMVHRTQNNSKAPNTRYTTVFLLMVPF